LRNEERETAAERRGGNLEIGTAAAPGELKLILPRRQ
jgi:hypothetical protein